MHSVTAVQTSYSVGWFALSLINAGLAQGKGRRGLGWWLLSLVIGPIATLLIVLLPALRDRRLGLTSKLPAQAVRRYPASSRCHQAH
jgi:hypothetical protein